MSERRKAAGNIRCHVSAKKKIPFSSPPKWPQLAISNMPPLSSIKIIGLPFTLYVVLQDLVSISLVLTPRHAHHH